MLRKDRTLHVVENEETSPDEGGASQSALLGQKLRRLRKQKGLSLTDLSKATGISVGFLSQVERDKSNPSVKTLHDISRALDVNITWFFSEESEKNPERSSGPVVRLRDRKKIRYGIDICDELLSPLTSRNIELIWSEFKPGASSGLDPYKHDGDEVGVVLSGVLDLTIGDTTYRLEAGDSFGFKSTTPHRYENPGETTSVVLWAITPPTY
ncbi:MAG: cupin domain-containing protein [Pseudomonadota bacterium]